jgi:hypothetical protein
MQTRYSFVSYTRLEDLKKKTSMAAKRYGNSGNSEGREDSPGLPASRYSDRRGGPPPYRVYSSHLKKT